MICDKEHSQLFPTIYIRKTLINITDFYDFFYLLLVCGPTTTKFDSKYIENKCCWNRGDWSFAVLFIWWRTNKEWKFRYSKSKTEWCIWCDMRKDKRKWSESWDWNQKSEIEVILYSLRIHTIAQENRIQIDLTLFDSYRGHPLISDISFIHWYLIWRLTEWSESGVRQHRLKTIQNHRNIWKYCLSWRP